MALGAAVVREVAKMAGRPARQAVYYDQQQVSCPVPTPSVQTGHVGNKSGGGRCLLALRAAVL